MTRSKRSPRLSAVLVDYRSAAFSIACVRSLQREWASAGFAAEELEIVVVENRSAVDQSPQLAELQELGVRVVRSPENLGYAGGIELGLAHTRGGEEDYLALLNPDLWFLPGSVRTMIEYLESHPECGAVGPRAWLDEERCLMLPRITLPSIRRELRQALAQRSRKIALSFSLAERASQLQWWQADRPVATPMLSGACLFLPRAVATKLGRVLDPGYPLYYEDADFARRIAGLGLALVMHPGAGVLHHWSRSAGFGADFEGEPRRRFLASRARYFQQHLSPLGRRGLQLVEQRLAKRGGGPPLIHDYTELGRLDHAPELRFSAKARVLIEISAAPHFPLAAGALLPELARWSLPVGPWAWLFPGRYWLRALDLATAEPRGAWTFEKRTPARLWPMGAAGVLARSGVAVL